MRFCVTYRVPKGNLLLPVYDKVDQGSQEGSREQKHRQKDNLGTMHTKRLGSSETERRAAVGAVRLVGISLSRCRVLVLGRSR